MRKHEGDLWLLCQDQGELWRFEPGNVDLLEQREVAETFHAPCDTPFCEDAHIGMDVTVAFGDMVYSDPALPGVRWLDGRDPVVLGLEHVATESAQRMGLRQLGWEIVVHEPWTRSSWLVTNQGATQAPDWGSTRTTFPVVGGGELVWLGAKSVDTSHVSQIDLGQNISVVGVSERWIVAEHGWDVEVYDAGTLERLTLLSMSSLRAPPFVHTTSGEPGPMRYLVVEPELLVIGNTFRATLELRHLPTLAPIGTDEPLALGEWSHLDGIR